jgi:hypothetical protein
LLEIAATRTVTTVNRHVSTSAYEGVMVNALCTRAEEAKKYSWPFPAFSGYIRYRIESGRDNACQRHVPHDTGWCERYYPREGSRRDAEERGECDELQHILWPHVDCGPEQMLVQRMEMCPGNSIARIKWASPTSETIERCRSVISRGRGTRPIPQLKYGSNSTVER